jgi:molecular chaperone DnaJ
MHTGGALPQAQRYQGRTLYQVLQVDPLADPEVIEVAFKRLALKHHPDRSAAPGAAGRMRELNEAKDILGDPRRRALYDRSIGIVHRIDAMRPEEV